MEKMGEIQDLHCKEQKERNMTEMKEEWDLNKKYIYIIKK